MLRTVLIAATALTTSTLASAENKQVNLDIRLDPTSIVDAASAETALRSVASQAERACEYKMDSIRRTYVDDICVDEIIGQVVAAIDDENFSIAYANSKEAVKLAQRED